MASTILTPSAIWGDFTIDGVSEARIVGEKLRGDIMLTRIMFGGRKTDSGNQVEIYGVVARSIQVAVMPAVLIVQDVAGGADEDLAFEFAKKGYYALSIDIAGKSDDKEFYTIYPDELDYAEYSNVKNNLTEVKGDVKKTCWYEWTAVVKYALAYLKAQSCITKIGAIGVGESATALWQVAGTEDTLNAVAFVMNAGWRAYDKNFKFGKNGAPQFSDNMLKYIAGVEPQSYSSHVKCPTLVLCSTYSDKYDLDRAYDTISRMSTEVYTAVDYSLGYKDHLDSTAFNDTFIFFDEFLMRAKKKTNLLPKEIEIKCDVVDGKIVAEVIADKKNLKDVCLYIAEETINPALRSYFKLNKAKIDGEVYKFEYSPFNDSEMVFVFAKARYKNGFSISSNVVARKFKPEEVSLRHKENILYSGRIENCESVFVAGFADGKVSNSFLMDTNPDNQLVVETGPMDIDGVYSSIGLTSLKVNAKKDKPTDGAILMLDLYCKEEDLLTVKLVADVEGFRTEYFATAHVMGGNIWHNVKIDMAKFKTEEGRILKSYDRINSVSFKCGGKYLINNVLWV